MKKIIKIFALGLLSMAFFSCQDAKLPSIENMLYISDAAHGKIGIVTMAEDTDTKVSFTVRLAKIATEDVKVNITIEPYVLAQYNEKYHASFRHVEAEKITAPRSAIIPAGSYSSDPLTISVREFDPMGAQYAVAFKITSTGNVKVAEASSKYIVQLMKPLKQLVPKFAWDNAMAANPANEDWKLELMNYSLEWWVRMTGKAGIEYGLNKNNQAIINSGGTGAAGHTELYIRFGDLVYSDKERPWLYNNRFLQIKTMGGQFDTGDPNVTPLTSGNWYHFAITYDGTTGESILYQNGSVVGTLNTGPGRAMYIDRFQMCSSGSSWFVDYAEMCQVRLWKTTRSASQIQNNMNFEVEYQHPDLLMYLPMSEGSGSMLHDVSGNGHDCKIGSHPDNGYNTEAVAWTEYSF